VLAINKKLQLIILGLGGGYIATFLVNILFSFLPASINPTRGFDLFFYTLFFKPTMQSYSKLVIIDSNDPTESRSRGEYADMIHRLHQTGAKCVVLNIRFLGERRYDPTGDQALVRSVTEWPEVVLAVDFASNSQPNPLSMMMVKRLALPDSLCENFFPIFVASGLELPFDSLLFVTRHIGHNNVFSQEYHHSPPVISFEQKCYASLPIEIAKIYIESVDSSANTSSWLANLPKDRDGQIWANFIPSYKFRLYSLEEAWAILQHSTDNLFKDTIVIIVNSAIESRVPTPLGAYPRWAILASLTSQLLQNRNIETSILFYPAILSASLVLLSLIWLLFIASRFEKKWHRSRLIFIFGNGLLFLCVFLLLSFGQHWLGVIVPLLAYNVSLLIVTRRYERLIKPSLYIDLVLTILERYGDKYPIQIVSPVGEDQVDASFRSFIEGAQFHRALERLHRLEVNRSEMRWIGNELFNILFSSNSFNILMSSLEIAKQENKKLRIKLRIDSPELVGLPWELMHSDRLPPGFILLHDKLALARYIPFKQRQSKQQSRLPLKILVVISSPHGLVPIDVEAEKKLIQKSLRQLTLGRDVRLKFCETATLEKFRTEFQRHQPDVLHYIGYSDFDQEKLMTFLAFEDEKGELRHVDLESFGSILYESPVKLVVLNNGWGRYGLRQNQTFIEAAQYLMRFGVPAVVAMQFAIPDEFAIIFSKVFYSTLIKHFSVDEAVAEARRAIMLRLGLNRADWAAPVLFTRGQSGNIFESE